MLLTHLSCTWLEGCRQDSWAPDIQQGAVGVQVRQQLVLHARKAQQGRLLLVQRQRQRPIASLHIDQHQSAQRRSLLDDVSHGHTMAMSITTASSLTRWTDMQACRKLGRASCRGGGVYDAVVLAHPRLPQRRPPLRLVLLHVLQRLHPGNRRRTATSQPISTGGVLKDAGIMATGA